MKDEHEDMIGGRNDDYDEGSSFSPVKIVVITLLVLFIIGASVAGIGGYYIYTNLQPVDPESEAFVMVEVPMGSSGTTIASILKEHNLIKNEKIFYYYIRYHGHSGFQAGEYQLSPSMELDEMIEQLKEGRLHQEVERFTVPEGYTIQQMAEHLEEEGLVDQEQFLHLVNEGDFSEFSFLEYIPDDVEGRKYRLEGFLFPETYEIFKGASEEDIIRIMLKQFEQEFNSALEAMSDEGIEWEEQIERLGLNEYEFITLASIIEREAVLDEERSVIAGVFHNRIREDWLLQSCATVQFVLEKPRERLLYEDLEVESPYNTYMHEGLPPGPIASPGRESIKAALNPEDHEYFYFVTKKDGTGAHHFSRTFEEHQRNNAQSRGNF
ncbi:endolytic transglycosylase MltG [Caldalkalibacillus salinus]|uniref:endolytic transglycosylase MltG n=1 Tax=Caldalkalibacillus salinus TaxID=2803787 RepID=UPI001F016B13|nr:endolytic transglycosylase MltG [Caldalkalibacillus salinus]